MNDYGYGNEQDNGFGRLGAALGGGILQNAFQRGTLFGMRQTNLLQMARKNRDENLAREAITPESGAESHGRGPHGAGACYIRRQSSRHLIS